MGNMVNKWMAAVLALGALAMFVACGKTEPETTAALVIEEIMHTTDDFPANVPTSAEPEPAEVTATEAATSVEPTMQAVVVTEPAAKTTAVATTKPKPTTTKPKKPGTTAEILAYANQAVAAAKADKPGYSYQNHTAIDDSKVSSANGTINTIAPGVIRMAKSSWDKWSDETPVDRGGDHSALPPRAVLQSDWVKSAACTESNGVYQIRINLVDERVADLPVDWTSTIHGKAAMVHTKGEIYDGAAKLGVNIQKFDCQYSGSYLDLTVNVATGKLQKVSVYVFCQVDMDVKFGLISLSASIPLAQEEAYTLNY